MGYPPPLKRFQYKDITVRFLSTGGVESCYILPEQKIAFDMGRGPFELIDIPNVFLSHGHLDHAAGIAYYFSQRSLKGLDPGTIYAPGKIVKSLKKICKQWQKIEGFNYRINILPFSTNKLIPLAKDYYLQAFKAFHRVSAQGYVLYKKNRKLKPQYQGLSSNEIKNLRDKGIEIVNIEKRPLFAYSGDTTIEFIQNFDVKKARVLFMECTYIDQERPVERARKWGHTHLDEIIESASLLENEKIVLVHISKRYSHDYINRVLDEKLPNDLKEKIEYIR